MKKGFTLAEVLITLGIIGVVASMTMPALIQKNNNSVVEARLKKFYSAINQAVMMAEVDYGDKKIWYEDLAGAEIDKDGNPVSGSSESEKWFNKYLAPYLKIVKTETLSDGSFIKYFADGSAVAAFTHSTRDWKFFPGKPESCLKKYPNHDDTRAYGVCVFLFNFHPIEGYFWLYHQNKGFEPWKYNWDGSIESLKNSCYNNATMGGDSTVSGKAYCSSLIQMNGWKIPDDYPYKVSY